MDFFDFDMFSDIVNFVSLGLTSVVIYMLRKLAAKTSTTIDDVIVEKLADYTKQLKNEKKSKKE